MKKNICKIIMIAICIMTVTTTNVMANSTTSVTVEQGKPRSPKLKTTSVRLKKTTQLQKNQIVSQLVAIKGIKSAYFSGNTVYISYNSKRLTAANAQTYAKNAYNSVVAKKQHTTPQAGRYGNTPQNQPAPQNNAVKPNTNNKQQYNNGKQQNNNGKQQNGHSAQPKSGRK